MAIQGELPARMHRFELFHYRVELVDEDSRARCAVSMIWNR